MKFCVGVLLQIMRWVGIFDVFVLRTQYLLTFWGGTCWPYFCRSQESCWQSYDGVPIPYHFGSLNSPRKISSTCDQTIHITTTLKQSIQYTNTPAAFATPKTCNIILSFAACNITKLGKPWRILVPNSLDMCNDPLSGWGEIGPKVAILRTATIHARTDSIKNLSIWG